MKKYAFLMFLVCSNLMAQDIVQTCSEQFGGVIVTQMSNLKMLGKNCLIKDYVTSRQFDQALMDEFLTLDKEVGENSWDLHYLSDFRLFKIKYSYSYMYRSISEKGLKELANFGINELGIYTEDDIFGGDYWEYLDVLRDARQYNKDEFLSFMSDIVTPKEPELDEDATEETIAKAKRKTQIYDQAMEQFANLMIGTNKSVTIYPLLDNNNENVQDAQWIIIGDGYIVLMNKYWYL